MPGSIIGVEIFGTQNLALQDSNNWSIFDGHLVCVGLHFDASLFGFLKHPTSVSTFFKYFEMGQIFSWNFILEVISRI